MNLNHKKGASKAKFLKDVLGYKLGDGEILHEVILKAIKDTKPYYIEKTKYGIKYKFKAKIKSDNESYCEVNVVVVVQKDNGKLVWRIVTLYPGKKER